MEVRQGLGEGWLLSVDIVTLSVRFTQPMYHGDYSVRFYISDGQGFVSTEIDDEVVHSIPSRSGNTTITLSEEGKTYQIPGAAHEADFSSGTALVCFELFSRTEGVILSGNTTSWYTINVV